MSHGIQMDRAMASLLRFLPSVRARAFAPTDPDRTAADPPLPSSTVGEYRRVRSRKVCQGDALTRADRPEHILDERVMRLTVIGLCIMEFLDGGHPFGFRYSLHRDEHERLSLLAWFTKLFSGIPADCSRLLFLDSSTSSHQQMGRLPDIEEKKKIAASNQLAESFGGGKLTRLGLSRMLSQWIRRGHGSTRGVFSSRMTDRHHSRLEAWEYVPRSSGAA